VSVVETVSVVWFTSTSWRRDRVSAPYNLLTGLAECSVCGGTLMAESRMHGRRVVHGNGRDVRRRRGCTKYGVPNASQLEPNHVLADASGRAASRSVKSPRGRWIRTMGASTPRSGWSEMPRCSRSCVCNRLFHRQLWLGHRNSVNVALNRKLRKSIDRRVWTGKRSFRNQPRPSQGGDILFGSKP